MHTTEVKVPVGQFEIKGKDVDQRKVNMLDPVQACEVANRCICAAVKECMHYIKRYVHDVKKFCAVVGSDGDMYEAYTLSSDELGRVLTSFFARSAAAAIMYELEDCVEDDSYWVSSGVSLKISGRSCEIVSQYNDYIMEKELCSETLHLVPAVDLAKYDISEAYLKAHPEANQEPGK